MFACIPDMSCTHFRHVPHAFWTCPASGKKGYGIHICFTAALLRVLDTSSASQTRPTRVSATSWNACQKRVQDMSGICMRHVRASAKTCDKAAAWRTWVPCPFFPDAGHTPHKVKHYSTIVLQVCSNIPCSDDSAESSFSNNSFSFGW